MATDKYTLVATVFYWQKNDVFITTIDKLSLINGIAMASGFDAFIREENILYDTTKEYTQRIDNFH